LHSHWPPPSFHYPQRLSSVTQADGIGTSRAGKVEKAVIESLVQPFPSLIDSKVSALEICARQNNSQPRLLLCSRRPARLFWTDKDCRGICR
jgi:hypothetical protein